MGTKKTKRVRFTFLLSAPGAKDVNLVGTFNDWNVTKHPMKKNNDEVWSKTVVIPPGTYEYKFLVGDEWWHDPENEHVTYNKHGTFNSIITIE